MYLRGKVWWAGFKREGKLFRFSLGTTDKGIAKRKEAKLIVDFDKYGQKNESRRKTLEDLATCYLQEFSSGIAPKTMLRHNVSLKHLLPVFGKKRLSEIKPYMINNYKVMRRDQSASASSINKELALAKHLYYIAIKQLGWIAYNPFSQVPLERMPAGRVRYLQEDEFDRLCAVCDEPLRSLVILAANTGLREDNLLSLTWQQINFRNETITVEHTKNRQPICIPMTHRVKSLLVELGRVKRIDTPFIFPTPTGKKICNTLVSRRFRQACKKVGIQDFRFHDLRHHFASMLVQHGVDLYTIKKLLGHQTIGMTERYSHLAVSNLKNSMAVLDQIQGKGITMGDHSGTL